MTAMKSVTPVQYSSKLPSRGTSMNSDRRGTSVENVLPKSHEQMRLRHWGTC